MVVKKGKPETLKAKKSHNSAHKGKIKPKNSVTIENKNKAKTAQKNKSGKQTEAKKVNAPNNKDTSVKEIINTSSGNAKKYKTSSPNKQKSESQSEKWKEIKRKRKNKKANLLNNKDKKVNVNLAKLEGLLDLEKKGKIKKPLTGRQKHKLMKLKLKRELKAKTNSSEDKKTDTEAQKQTAEQKTNVSSLKVPAVPSPKVPENVSSNWKKFLQETGPKSSRKRKLSPDKIINPKYKKSADEKKTESQTSKKPDIWFDDVDEFLLEGVADTNSADEDDSTEKEKPNPLVKKDAYKGLTKAVAMDCEMVGVGDGSESMVARVSIVNQHGEPIYDKYVTPKEAVKDYRTHVSGIRPGDLDKGEDLEKVQKDVADILKGRLLVGHAIQNDLQVLFLQHPRKNIRDTSRYKEFRRLFQGRTPSLKNLSATLLQVKVQEGEHNSIQDAQAAMRLYTLVRKKWESNRSKKIKGRKGKKTKKG